MSAVCPGPVSIIENNSGLVYFGLGQDDTPHRCPCTATRVTALLQKCDCRYILGGGGGGEGQLVGTPLAPPGVATGCAIIPDPGLCTGAFTSTCKRFCSLFSLHTLLSLLSFPPDLSLFLSFSLTPSSTIVLCLSCDSPPSPRPLPLALASYPSPHTVMERVRRIQRVWAAAFSHSD